MICVCVLCVCVCVCVCVVPSPDQHLRAVSSIREGTFCVCVDLFIIIATPVIVNRLEARAEELLAEEQAGFRPGRSTVEEIFSSGVIKEKHLQHQRDLFHNFIDLKKKKKKKACDRVWHVGLWQVLRSFKMHEGLVQAIQAHMRIPAVQSS